VIVLRYVYALALAIWLGGAAVIGAIVAPAAFAVLEAREGAAGRVAAGAVVGAVLRSFHLVAYGAGSAMLLCLGAMALVGPRPRPFAARLLLVSGMLGAALLSGVFVTGRIEQLQREIRGPVSQLEPGDARRAAFGRYHAASTLLMGLNVAGALVLLYWETRR
jgi:uncharacterized membrane protein